MICKHYLYSLLLLAAFGGHTAQASVHKIRMIQRTRPIVRSVPQARLNGLKKTKAQKSKMADKLKNASMVFSSIGMTLGASMMMNGYSVENRRVSECNVMRYKDLGPYFAVMAKGFLFTLGCSVGLLGSGMASASIGIVFGTAAVVEYVRFLGDTSLDRNEKQQDKE